MSKALEFASLTEAQIGLVRSYEAWFNDGSTLILYEGATNYGVARTGSSQRVIALEPIEPGTLITEIGGRLVDAPSMYSVQLDDNLHIEANLGEDPAWRYLNHHSDPNSLLNGTKLVSLKHIKTWDDITFDYNSNEYAMATPFVCFHTGELVRGFKFLSASRKLAMYHRVAAYLQRLVDMSRAQLVLEAAAEAAATTTNSLASPTSTSSTSTSSSSSSTAGFFDQTMASTTTGTTMTTTTTTNGGGGGGGFSLNTAPSSMPLLPLLSPSASFSPALPHEGSGIVVAQTAQGSGASPPGGRRSPPHAL